MTHHFKAETALDCMVQDNFDLVITDLVLDGEMQGKDLIRCIRALKGSMSNIPILVVTGIDDAKRKVSLLKSGASDYVAKPVLEDELLARTSNLIRTKQLMDRTEAQQRKMQDIAMRGQLTGLYNRHFLSDMALKMIADAKRYNHPICFVLIDIDHFKKLNDTHGHLVGDQILVAVASALGQQTRESDILARFGGEEFVLIFTRCALEDASQRADKLRQALFDLKPHDLQVSASFGVSTLDIKSDDTSFESVLQKADQALYEAKASGRNRVVCYSK